ncbi:hypothetical protein [Streptomyces chartreusis]|uniref:hypothetical protein n=1 Tax=Streptomyces chartreusis TaxID=1969 RepID=UPI00368920DB
MQQAVLFSKGRLAQAVCETLSAGTQFKPDAEKECNRSGAESARIRRSVRPFVVCFDYAFARVISRL